MEHGTLLKYLTTTLSLSLVEPYSILLMERLRFRVLIV